MSPLRQHRLAALQLSGKGERTPASSVRDVRLLAQCDHQSPDRLSAHALQHSFLHRKNVDGLAPTSLRIGDRGIRFFSPHGLKRDGHPLALPARAHHPPSLAWASGSMQPSSCRSPTLRARASRARSIGARAPKTGPSPCPPRPSRCSVPPGKPLGTPPGSFPPPGGVIPKVLPRLPLCVAPGSRTPSASPNTGPGSPKEASPSIPSGTLRHNATPH